MTFDPRLVPMYELGLDFTQCLWSTGGNLAVNQRSCHNWSIILAMDIMAREACQ